MPQGSYSDPELQARYDDAVQGIMGASTSVPGYNTDPAAGWVHEGFKQTLDQFKQDALKQLQYSFDVIENPNSPDSSRRNAVTSIEKLSEIGAHDILVGADGKGFDLFSDYAKSVGALGPDRVVKAPKKKGDSFFQDRGFVAPKPQDVERELITPDWAQPGGRKTISGAGGGSAAGGITPQQLPNTLLGTAALLGSAPRPQYGAYTPAQLQTVQERGWQNPAGDPTQMIGNRSINSMQTVYGSDPFAFVNRIDQTGVDAQKRSIGYIDNLLSRPYQRSAFGADPYSFSDRVDQTGKRQQLDAAGYFRSVQRSPKMRSAMQSERSAFGDLPQSEWDTIGSAFGAAGDPNRLADSVDQTGIDAQKEGINYLRDLIANQGQDAVSRAHYEQALANSERTRSANVQAALSELDRQGRGGGGLALMAQLEGARGSMAEQFNASLEMAALEQQRRDAANASLIGAGNQLRAQQFGEAALSAQQIDALQAARAAGMDAFAISKATGLDQFTVQRATSMDAMAIYDQERRLAAANGQAQIGATLYGQELNAAIAAAGGIDAMYQSEAARRDAANVNRSQMGYNLRNQQASELFHVAGQIDQMTAARANLMARIDEINSGRAYASKETYNQYQRALDQVNAQIANQQELYNTGVQNQETFSQNRYAESSRQQALGMLTNALQQDAGRTVALLSQQMGLDANQQAGFINALNSAANRAQQQQIIDAQLQQRGVSGADVLGVLAPIAGGAIGGIAGGPAGAAVGGALGGGLAAAFGGSPTGLSAVPTISQAFMPSATPYQAPQAQPYQVQPRAGTLSADEF